MAISHVDTQEGSSSNSTSVVVTKPTGTASGDVLTAFVTSNYQNVTPPAGWSEIADHGDEIFRVHVFRKVAGGSEGANYTFTVSSSATLLCQMTAWRGVDNGSTVDISPVMNAASFNFGEPMATESVSGGSQGRLIYFRATRRASSGTPITYTASGVTELSDSGVAAPGSSFAYSGGLYMATSDYSSGGSKSGLSITASATESHNVTVTMALKAGRNTGSADIDMPSIPSMSVSGSVAYPATVAVSLPLPEMEASIFHGAYEGPLDIDVPISMSVSGNTPPRGSMSISMPPIIDIVVETRQFAENVVQVIPDKRAFRITQDDIFPMYLSGLSHRPVKPIYVSPTGDDDAQGNLGQPLATIAAAQAKVREYIAEGQYSDIQVYLRGGKYYQTAKLEFTEEDSGQNGFTVRWSAFRDEKPEIIGGVPVTGWTVHSGAIYKAQVGTAPFNRLYENGDWSIKARSPQAPTTWANSDPMSKTDLPAFTLVPGVQVVKRNSYWLCNVLPIASFSGNDIITTEDDPLYAQFTAGLTPKWYAQGAIEFLTEDGEFAHDRATGWLYYRPHFAPINQQEIIVPRTGTRLLEIKGSSEDADGLVKNLVFEGLSISCSDFPDTLNRLDGGNGDDDGRGREGLVYLENTQGIEIRNCSLRNAGVNGINLNRYNQQTVISGNLVENSGYCGIYLQGYKFVTTPTGPDVCRENTIESNYVRNTALSMLSGSGIKLFNSGYNTITRNRVTSTGHSGIKLEGGFGTDDELDQYLQGNVVSYNDISRFCREGADSGGVYLTRTGTDQNIIDHNWIHDFSATDPTGVNGLYMDDWTRYVVFSNNIISGRHHGRGSAIMNKGHHNIVTNNISHAVTPEDSDWTDLTYDAAAVQLYSDFQYTKNVLYHANQDNGTYYFYNSSGIDPGYYPGLITEWGDNVYYNPNGVYNIFGGGPAANVAGLISIGLDENSIIADPLFVDAADNDFRFSPGSPAADRGIIELDRNQMGLSPQFSVDHTSLEAPYKSDPGQVHTITFSNIPNATTTDWISLHPVGAPDDSSYAKWVYVNSGTMTPGPEAVESGTVQFEVPTWAGGNRYEFRIYSQDTLRRIIGSETATTVSGTATLGALAGHASVTCHN